MSEGVEVATAYVSLVVAGDKVAPGVRKAFQGAEGEATKSGAAAGKKFGGGLSTGVKDAFKGTIGALGVAELTRGVIDFGKQAVAEARESQKVGAQTGAVLKSTGGIANVTASQIGKLSTAISNKSGIDDEAIQSGANLLLTFTNVRNEVGKSNNIFDQATQIVTDMSSALGTDLKGSAIQVGKALNDPIKGITALTRVGVSFTDQQKAQITALVKGGDANAAMALGLIGSTTAYNALLKQNGGDAKKVADILTKDLTPAQKKAFDTYAEGGHTLSAQKKILRELNKEFGGSAAATATAGDKFKVAFDNLKESIGTAALPAIDKFETFLTKKGIPAAYAFGDAVGEAGKSLKPVFSLVEGILSPLTSLPGPVKKLGIEAAVLGLVMPRLSAAVLGAGGSFATAGLAAQSFGLKLLSAESRSGALAATASRMGSALKGAAGIGGMLLLAQSASTTNQGLKTLEQVGGAAMLGFSIGGPIGGAIAGGGVALFQLGKYAFGTGKNFGKLKPPADAIIGTLDQVTGAATKASAALAFNNLAKSGTFAKLNELRAKYGDIGVSQRDLVQASLGNAAAQDKVAAALKRTTEAAKVKAREGGVTAKELIDVQNTVKATNDLSGAVGANAKEFTKQGIAISEQHRALTPLKKLLGEDLANAAKNSAGNLRNLGGAVKAVPGGKRVKVTADTGGAIAALAGVRRTVDNLPKNPTIRLAIRVAVNAAVSAGAGGRKARALGGPVSARQTYWVGERGPELFTPNGSGKITANNRLANGVAPLGGGSVGSSRFQLVLDDGTELGGYMQRIADDRVAAGNYLASGHNRARPIR